MSRKVALLIGVSDYGEGIPSLSAPINDVAAMERVLKNPNMGGFDQVEPIINPEPTAMRLAVQQIFANCHKDDLVLLFFSGHGITDDNNRLYLATKGTSKDFYKATSVPASFIQDISLESYAKRQVIVLDCCYSGAFAEGWQAKSVGIHLEKELGAEGRVVLTSSTATQTSFQQEDEELSLYTQYLIEGIETGAADKEGNGKIYAHELHDYAKAKVQEVKPKQKPEIIIDREGFNILLSQAPVDDPELDFRKLVEKYATEGQITVAGNYILRVKRQELDITEEKSDEIVNEVLAPYRKRIENIKLYKQAFTEAVEQKYPLTERLLNELQDLEDVLGLEDKDITQIQQQILAEKEAEYKNQQEVQQQEQEEYENKLQQYEQEFLEAVEREYLLSENTRNEINILQQSLGIRDEDIKRIEQPILAQAEAKYQEKLKEEQKQRQKEQEAERVKQLELQKQQEQEEYENKLKQYEQEFIKAIQAEYPLNRDVRDSLKNYQETLEITDEDITRIEQPILAQEEAKYQEKLKQEKSKRQRQQETERAKQLELQKQQEREKQEEKLKQQDTEYQRRLKQYEGELFSAISELDSDALQQQSWILKVSLGLTDLDVASIDAKLLRHDEESYSQSQPRQGGFLSSEEKLKQHGTDYQRRLQQYEQKVSNAMRQGISPSHIRRELRQLQQTLGLTDSDVSFIEARLVSRQSPASNIPSPSQPRQAEILSSKVARRRVLLGGTILALIFSAFLLNRTPRPAPTDTVPTLISPKTGVDYTLLGDLLAEGKWKEADEETSRVMLQAANREKEGWLNPEDIDKFSCEDLRIIDQLWLASSKRKFGFSVQKEIYESLGGTRENVEDFGDRIGWRKGGKWLSYSDVNFWDNPPKGILPWHEILGEVDHPVPVANNVGEYAIVILDRAKTCNL